MVILIRKIARRRETSGKILKLFREKTSATSDDQVM